MIFIDFKAKPWLLDGFLKVHVSKFHEGVDNYKCNLCNKTFGNPGTLSVHVRSVHKGIKHQCEICGKEFTSNFSLQKHIKNIHEGMNKEKGQKNHICDLCGKAFNSKFYVKYHIDLVHKGKKFHKCEICKKDFGVATSLKKHIKIVHNNERKMCPICGKMLNPDFFKQHMVTTHSITNNETETLKCQFCQKVFVNNSKFKQHMNVHTGSKPHKCKYCGQGFADNSNKISHERSVHEGIKKSQKRNLISDNII